MSYNIGIVGYGYVGTAIHRLFGDDVTDIYDPYITAEKIEEKFKGVPDISKEETELDRFNKCDMVAVCVMTKEAEDKSCDISIVKSTLQWLIDIQYKGVILIKSAVSPLNTKALFAEFHRRNRLDGLRMVVSPEYIGEGKYFVPPWKYPHPTDMKQHTFQIFGGDKEDTSRCVDIFVRKVGPHVDFYQTDETTASVVKYMENSWGAMKVTFCQEWYDLCKKLNVDYNEMREIWTADSRVEKMHTAVFPDSRGYGGKCVVGTEVAIIQTPQGEIDIKTFEQLYKDPLSFTYKMLSVDLGSKIISFKPIEGIRCRTVEKTLNIRTDKGCQIRVTPDHKMIVYNSNTQSFNKKEAIDLELGDELPVAFDGIENDKPIERIDLLKVYDNIKMVLLNGPVPQEVMQRAYKENCLTYDQLRRLQGDSNLSVDFNFYERYRDVLPEVVKIQLDLKGKAIFDRFIEIDERWAKLIGYYLAEGSITGNRTYFSFGYEEKEYIEHAQQLLTELGFSWNTRVQKWNGEESCVVIWVNTRLLAFLLKRIFKCGINCYSKSLPNVFLTNRRVGFACLESLIKGDGCVYGGGRETHFTTINIPTSSRILSEQIGVLLRSINIFASYMQVKNKKSENLSYQLNISRKCDIEKLLSFISLIKKEESYVRNRLNKTRNIKGQKHTYYSDEIALVKVNRIEEYIEKIEVYSTQVVDNENFVTSNGLLVSNCFPKDVRAILNDAKEIGVDMKLLAMADEVNKKYRGDE